MGQSCCSVPVDFLFSAELDKDMSRELDDYARMGLPPLDNSLHFPQSSGYVHAVDLRTVGRPAWKNWTTVVYFRVLGFRTLRHVGSADHLHVSLAPPGDR